MKNNLLQKHMPNGWNVYTVDDVAFVFKGKGLSKGDINSSGENKCILYGQLFTTYKEVIKEVKSRTHIYDGIRSEEGDILIPGSTTTKAEDLAVASTILEGNVLLGGDINILRKKGDFYDPVFLSYYLTHYKKKEIGSFGQGSTIIHLYGRDIKKVLLALPSVPEQKKIADILSLVDEEINKVNSLISKTEELKKGLMQYIFNFSNKKDVKYLSLGDIGKVSMCKRIFKNETSVIGEIPFYKIGTFGKKSDSFISKELFNLYKNKFSFPRIGDVLLSASGTIGRKIRYDGEPAYFQDSNIIWLEHDESLVLNSFLYYLYDTVTWETEGSTIKRLYNNLFLKKIVPVPSIDTQKKSVEVLLLIDKKIELKRNLKEKLIQLKKGLMLDLLSGRIRVK